MEKEESVVVANGHLSDDDDEPKRGKPSEEIRKAMAAKPPTMDKYKYYEGPHTNGYESFVQQLFATGQRRTDASLALNSYSNGADMSTNLPASLQLKLDALSEIGDRKPGGYGGGGGSGFSTDYQSRYAPTDYESKYYPSKPSVGSDGFAAPRYGSEGYNTPRFGSDSYNSARYGSTDEKGGKQKQILLDYKKFQTSSKPFSKHLYSDANYVHHTDSRIVGSDFVMLTMRPNDNFLNKIDKTLAEARLVNSWDM